MKKLILGLVLTFSLGIHAAGTSRKLDIKEQTIVTKELALIIPSIADEGVTMENCTLGNKAKHGEIPAFEILCDLIIDDVFSGDLRLDQVEFKTGSYSIESVKFKSLKRH